MGVFGLLRGTFPVTPSPEAEVVLPVGCQKMTQHHQDLLQSTTGVVSPSWPVPLVVIQLYQSWGPERGRSSPAGCGQAVVTAVGGRDTRAGDEGLSCCGHSPGWRVGFRLRFRSLWALGGCWERRSGTGGEQVAYWELLVLLVGVWEGSVSQQPAGGAGHGLVLPQTPGQGQLRPQSRRIWRGWGLCRPLPSSFPVTTCHWCRVLVGEAPVREQSL